MRGLDGLADGRMGGWHRRKALLRVLILCECLRGREMLRLSFSWLRPDLSDLQNVWHLEETGKMEERWREHWGGGIFREEYQDIPQESKYNHAKMLEKLQSNWKNLGIRWSGDIKRSVVWWSERAALHTLSHKPVSHCLIRWQVFLNESRAVFVMFPVNLQKSVNLQTCNSNSKC